MMMRVRSDGRRCRAARLEAVGAVHRLVGPRLERDLTGVAAPAADDVVHALGSPPGALRLRAAAASGGLSREGRPRPGPYGEGRPAAPSAGAPGPRAPRCPARRGPPAPRPAGAAQP